MNIEATLVNQEEIEMILDSRLLQIRSLLESEKFHKEKVKEVSEHTQRLEHVINEISKDWKSLINKLSKFYDKDVSKLSGDEVHEFMMKIVDNSKNEYDTAFPEQTEE